ncbi:hypothetical protein PPERSA_02252 [Pseudocohnilembus persalinus]|uniref:Actin-related protein 2/3 complex subunit 4 n=1 Tax=Pseudocohnilembus persalinus TaxID=266149 RepID=A0A0V0QKT7_PSEPJ|nr:hypothetical protein PPERSA_02252 [Pseudocohnilembus persalinus]|eukprot:KRX02762.1 hypothetical protein PPERSA_02252 [Pseudocohnilembus persalinus]
MALDLKTYINAIGSSLDAALCLSDFPSEIVEKDNKPEVELFGYMSKTKPLVNQPIYIARSVKEKCLIESSINSCRISFAIKQNDELDKLIGERFSRYITSRADQFEILRRIPLKGYDVTFLISSSHLEKYDKAQLISYITDFIQDIEKYMTEIKLNIVFQTRKAAKQFVQQMSDNQ